MNGPELAALLGAWVRSVPRLPEAACRAEPWIADVDLKSSRGTVDAALEVCLGCPAMDRCAEWVDSLPADERPAGVVAARLTVDGRDMTAARAAMREALTARSGAAA